MILYSNSTTNTRGQINAVLSVEESDYVYGYGEEPVTLQEVKNYCKIDFDDEDELLLQLITTARQELEKYCGLSFIPKRLTAILQNDCGGIEIPYGPVQGVIDTTLITGIDGNEVEIYLLGGSQFPFIQTQIEYVQLIYDAGYYVLPQALKVAIMAQVFFLYENRGEKIGFGAGDSVRQYNPDFIATASLQLCAKYRRNWDAMF